MLGSPVKKLFLLGNPVSLLLIRWLSFAGFQTMVLRTLKLYQDLNGVFKYYLP